jgi:hypothetical protein
MSAVPPTSFAVARSLQQAMPSLKEATLVWSSEVYNSGGEVFAIINPGHDLVDTLASVLGISNRLDGARSYKRTWSWYRICGFNMEALTGQAKCPYHPTQSDWLSSHDLFQTEKCQQEVVAATQIMADTLHDGFEFLFINDDIPVAPFIYGGYTSDGSIVGIITSRVWTRQASSFLPAFLFHDSRL